MTKNGYFKSLFKSKEPLKSIEMELGEGPVLKITIGEKHVATLFHDDSNFCLVYLPEFLKTGLPPFNPEDLMDKKTVEISKCYLRKDLWFVFAERLTALDREDFIKELAKF